ncbi:hypothetical protein CDEST_15459 [Colletotrichum destructivum]|uniref:Uncharacterized protein n=1 Tax=Colletotrichum destructivum TaxID=34406 RepID=A0AAX4J4L0_9PEZI|nr:hypothetical protein CDEST_15459 [Colletotrichum destructivum]
MAAVDEKHVKALAESPGSQTDGNHTEIDWSAEEEQRLVRKVDLLIMLLLILAFFALQLDRRNININFDSFCKIPSNLILYRIGPTLWIGGQIVAW